MRKIKKLQIESGVDNPKFRVGNWLVDELPATCELKLK